MRLQVDETPRGQRGAVSMLLKLEGNSLQEHQPLYC